MMRKFIAMFATVAFAMATFATPASAQRWHDRGGRDGGYSRDHGGYDNDRRHGRGYYNRPECYDRQGRNHCYDRHDNDNDDAVAAGVIGLVLGAVIASAVANSNTRQDDGYYRDDGYRGDDGYRDDRGYRDSDGYYDPRSQCTQQVRRWDRRAGRYVIVTVAC
jgi:hypothetical protein